MTSARELLEEVEDLSRRAYELARAQADGDSAADVERREDATAIDRRLDELVPSIQCIDDPQVAAIQEAWTDARSDVMWVLSGGTLPASLRLGAYLREHDT
jgi:hypothetical protein